MLTKSAPIPTHTDFIVYIITLLKREQLIILWLCSLKIVLYCHIIKLCVDDVCCSWSVSVITD